MLKKYAILLGVIIALSLLVIAAMNYPGGTQYDKNSVGFDWKANYLSNLFDDKAINGADNSSKLWAIAAMFFLSLSCALFFYEFSKKIPLKLSANIIRYSGMASMLFVFLAVTRYHDIVLFIASPLSLLSMFYITIFVFKSKLHFFKILCVACLLALYTGNFIYGTTDYIYLLPALQKIEVGLIATWVLGLTYFSRKEDFEHIQMGKK